MSFTALHQVENTNDLEFLYAPHHGEEESVPLHFHKNYEVIIATAGKCLATIASETFSLQQGDVLLVLPFLPHSITAVGDADFVLIDFHKHLILSFAETNEKSRLVCPVFHPTGESVQMFLSQLQALFGNESAAFRRIAPVHVRFKVKGLLYFFISGELASMASFLPIGKSDSVIIDVVHYIADHFKGNVSLHDIAKEKGYNYQYLSRTFNKSIGLNFKKILNQYRMECAFALLQDTDLSLSEIALESGFQSFRSFDKVCRESFGVSPSELRRRSKTPKTGQINATSG